jgi:hypothetical protein
MVYPNRVVHAVSQATWNGFRPHFACLEAGGQFSLRELGGKGFIDFFASADAALDASSCALKLEHSLCQGMACDKGCLGEISTE